MTNPSRGTLRPLAIAATVLPVAVFFLGLLAEGRPPPLSEIWSPVTAASDLTAERVGFERPLSQRAAPGHRGRWLALAALLVAVAAAAVVLAGGQYAAVVPPGPAPADLTPARYDGTFTFDDDHSRWTSDETFDVPLAHPHRGHPMRLADGWRYAGPGHGPRRATYTLQRTLPARTSPWPFVRRSNQVPVPLAQAVHAQPTVPGGHRPRRRTYVADDHSLLRLTGPLRLVGDTTPAATKRANISGDRKTLEFELAGLRYHPDRRQIDVEIADAVARSGLYAFTIKFGKWLVIAITLPAVGFFVNRLLKRRLGDSTKPAPVAVPAAAGT